MVLQPGPRKILLVTHISTSVGLLGAVAGFLLLAIIGLTSGDLQLARSVYPAMDLITRLLILPLVLASLGVGVVQSLATPLGLVPPLVDRGETGGQPDHPRCLAGADARYPPCGRDCSVKPAA